MRRTQAHRRRERLILAELENRLWPGRRATIVGYLWWWRYELAIALTAPAALVLVIRGLGAGPAAVGALLTLGVCCLWPPARHAVVTAAWRVITPHRLRAAFVQARIYSRNGRLPTIVRTSREPFGERVTLWCHAGVTAADLRSARDVLAAACWAADVRVSGDARHAHLVTLDVIRPGTGPDEPQKPTGPAFHNEHRPDCPLTGPDAPGWPEGPPPPG
jgi:hypothetical protein